MTKTKDGFKKVTREECQAAIDNPNKNPVADEITRLMGVYMKEWEAELKIQKKMVNPRWRVETELNISQSI